MKTFLFSLLPLLSVSLSAQVFRPDGLGGAIVGAAVGAVIGHNDGRHGWEGAAYGAAAGALLGSLADHRDGDWGRGGVDLRVGYDYRPGYPDRRLHGRGYRGGLRQNPVLYSGWRHYPTVYSRGGYGRRGGWGDCLDFRLDVPLNGCDYPDYGYGSWGARGAVLGGIAGAVIGHNDGRHGWEGAAYGLGAGWIIGSIADREAREREAAAVAACRPRAEEPVRQQVAPQQVTIINNYSNTASAMTAANGLFGR